MHGVENRVNCVWKGVEVLHNKRKKVRTVGTKKSKRDEAPSAGSIQENKSDSVPTRTSVPFNIGYAATG